MLWGCYDVIFWIRLLSSLRPHLHFFATHPKYSTRNYANEADCALSRGLGPGTCVCGITCIFEAFLGWLWDPFQILNIVWSGISTLEALFLSLLLPFLSVQYKGIVPMTLFIWYQLSNDKFRNIQVFRFPKRQRDLPFQIIDSTPLSTLNRIEINREANTMVSCTEGATTIFEADKSLF